MLDITKLLFKFQKSGCLKVLHYTATCLCIEYGEISFHLSYLISISKDSQAPLHEDIHVSF